MMDVVARFRVVLDANNLHMKLFDQYAVQMEKWLQGELLSFFDADKTNGKLNDYWPESSPQLRTRPSTRRVDYELELLDAMNVTKIWVELKHFQIGYQKEQCWNAYDYFAGKSSWGVYGDVVKLQEIVSGDKYMLILATRNPGYDDWAGGVDKFHEKFSHLHILSHTDPSSFPTTYFLGLLEVPPP
jgi:hypothetical protein